MTTFRKIAAAAVFATAAAVAMSAPASAGKWHGHGHGHGWHGGWGYGYGVTLAAPVVSYYDDYGPSCHRLKRRAIRTGLRRHWRAYHACLDGY